jgi:hypothetical protein
MNDPEKYLAWFRFISIFLISGTSDHYAWAVSINPESADRLTGFAE